MKIISFSAKKQGGKTTAVNFLMDKLPRAEIVCFADELKDIVCRCFGAKTDDCWGSDKAKSKKLPCGKRIREVLQIVGTNWFRSLDSDCWIRAFRERLAPVEKYCDPILVPDVRFPNEVKCIQELGGHVIRLLRAPFPEDKHESETALDTVEFHGKYKIFGGHRQEDGSIKPFLRFDAIIDNREMTIEEQNEAVWKLVTEREWV